MPEHRQGTPEKWRLLESFLWHDLEADHGRWEAWVREKMPELQDGAEGASRHDASLLHQALRSLQAANNAVRTGGGTDALDTLNRLIVRLAVRPHLAGNAMHLASGDGRNPVSVLLLTALGMMQIGEWRRFKLCREPTCRASFYDASRPAAKSWCSMQRCGSRNKMRRYRSRD